MRIIAPRVARARARNGLRSSAQSKEEADETLFWLEVAVEAEVIPAKRAEALLQEADELTAIFVASLKTAKR